MKYIMFRKRGKELTQWCPIIFPNFMVHSDIAEKMLDGPLWDWIADSAGEINVEGECHGFSGTLGLCADEDRDTRMINMADYGGLLT